MTKTPLYALFALLLCAKSYASEGDRLPAFKACVAECVREACDQHRGVPIPPHRRLLLWTCPSECDYTCQHVVTDTRLARDPPYIHPVLQFHGKWPFHRFFGIQEPFSVLFSLFNYLAHDHGVKQVQSSIPESYGLRKYYVAFGYLGLATWTCSMIFHTRDFGLTEKLDYFAAAASIMYGLFYAPIRIFRLDMPTPTNQSIVRLWTMACVTLYLCHVAYLSLWRFDYTYNMAANVAVGIMQNLLWTGFSIRRYRQTRRLWAAWPGLIVAWLVLAMSLELVDFPPWGGMVDAHSLWHLGTVVPTLWWYNFLVKDSKENLQDIRLKA